MPLLGPRPDGFSCRQCSAHSKRSGLRCRNYAVLGRSTCRMHGGASRRGKDHWNYRDGRFSKDRKEVLDTFPTFQLPIQVAIAIYPDALGVGGKVHPQGQPRPVIRVSFPVGPLPLEEQLRALREANRQLNTELRLLRSAKKQVLSQLLQLGARISGDSQAEHA